MICESQLDSFTLVFEASQGRLITICSTSPLTLPALHRAILIVDVEGFGDPNRTNTHQLAIRDALYKALKRSLADVGIRWDVCVAEDRGDGALILIPPTVSKIYLVTDLVSRLADNLAKHNAACPAHEQIRLRMALHAGEVHQDAHGFTSTSLNLAFRLIQSPESRVALHDSRGILVLIVSNWFYGEVVRHYPDAEPECFRKVFIEVKETKESAWIRVLETRKEPEQPACSAAAVKQNRIDGRYIPRSWAAVTVAAVLLQATLMPPGARSGRGATAAGVVATVVIYRLQARAAARPG